MQMGLTNLRHNVHVSLLAQQDAANDADYMLDCKGLRVSVDATCS